jgi:uncharacterized protein YdeI (YjbR/CyaY-like superfamily)
MAKELREIRCKNRTMLRKWLQKNCHTKESVWLIIHKKNSTVGSLSYNDAVEEALCFGWIDSKPNKLDDETYKLLYSPRKPKSVWSRVNKQKIEMLVEQGLMHSTGLATIEAAKMNGSWQTLDAIEALQMPTELEKALSKSNAARKYFDAFPASVRKQLFWWIASAKREETQKRRVEETVSLAEKNIRANQYKPK